MAGEFRSLPLESGPVDPTRLVNANYAFIQRQLLTSDNQFYPIFSESPSADGILMYEVRVIGKSTTNLLSIKKTFTVIKTASQVDLLDISSDYTKKTDASWNITIEVASSDIIIKVKGSGTENVNWAAQIIKTIHYV